MKSLDTYQLTSYLVKLTIDNRVNFVRILSE